MVDHHHQRLVEKARTGEHSAFRELMECHQQKIYYLQLDAETTSLSNSVKTNL